MGDSQTNLYKLHCPSRREVDIPYFFLFMDHCQTLNFFNLMGLIQNFMGQFGNLMGHVGNLMGQVGNPLGQAGNPMGEDGTFMGLIFKI